MNKIFVFSGIVLLLNAFGTANLEINENANIVSKTQIAKSNDFTDFYIKSPILKKLTEDREWVNNGSNGFFIQNVDDSNSVYIERINEYGNTPNANSGYAFSESLKKEILKSNSPCKVLDKIKIGSLNYDNSELSLPVNLLTPFLCKSPNKIDANLKIVSLIGLSKTDEELPKLANLILVIRRSDVILISNIISDQMTVKLNSEIQNLIDEFLQNNSNVKFPSLSFYKLDQLIQTRIYRALASSDPELMQALTYLNKIAQSIKST